MNQDRRTRPTFRVIAHDLDSDWSSPWPRRLVAEQRYDELSAVSELPHPLIEKAARAFGDDESSDSPEGVIRAAKELVLFEVKTGQWRGGVWRDPADGIHWLIAAGKAKGDHVDSDDFYKQIERMEKSGSLVSLLPTVDDRRQLKWERSARRLLEWELSIQADVLDALGDLVDGGAATFVVHHPHKASEEVAEITIEVAQIRSGIPVDDIVVEVQRRGRASEAMLWQITMRVLTSINPPAQDWDSTPWTFSTIVEPGGLNDCAKRLQLAVERDQLDSAIPGATSHYAHRRGLADSAVNGEAVRALCGVFFVPTQDHDALPTCPICVDRWNEIKSRE